MANEKRVRALAIGGLVEDNPLAVGGVTLTSAGLAAMPAIGATEHAAITLDPDGIFGAPEVAYITAHTAGAVTATIARGQETTTARQHDRDVPWIHGPTLRDFPRFVRASSTADLALAATTWTDVPGMSVSIAAQVGDELELYFAGLVLLVAATTTQMRLNFKVNGVQAFDATNGSHGMLAHSTTNLTLHGTAYRTVVAGDLSSGLVTAVPQVWASDATRTVEGTTPPMQLGVKNLGAPV